MPTKHRKTSVKRSKKRTFSRKLRRLLTKKRGGCGCGNSQPLVKSPDFFAGGKRKSRKLRGGVALGPASLPADFDTDHSYSYPLKNIANDPLNNDVQIASRQLPNIIGGKKKRGGASDPVLDSYNKNLLTSSNTIQGASVGAGIISGNVDSQNYDTKFQTPMFL